MRQEGHGGLVGLGSSFVNSTREHKQGRTDQGP